MANRHDETGDRTAKLSIQLTRKFIMIYSEVIIVGGGPAGSTCAWKLKQAGIECLILDKDKFPRTKLCAGWITPKVIKDLEIDLQSYSHSLISFNKLHINIYGLNLKIKTRQYSIRRYEFDNWLLRRSEVPVIAHDVNSIERDHDYYVIDGEYRCKYLVGAGGSFCPVNKIFFKGLNPRSKKSLVVALEEEFAYDHQDHNCYLWFFERNLPGYSWYVPKGNGHLNVGIGGLSEKLKSNNQTIKDHWDHLVQKLKNLSLVKNYRFNPKGYAYYLRSKTNTGQIDRTFIIGDAAGLATKDLGEGIGPAVESGLLAARSIINGIKYSFGPIKKYSILGVITGWP